jgi:very-short-patch-repair endonuclease
MSLLNNYSMGGKIVIERNMFYGAHKSIFAKAFELRNNLTAAEKILWERLKDRKTFRDRFKSQHPVDIFIVDFYCHRHKLAIEVDGEIHLNEDTLSYDQGRQYEIEKFGIKVLRFTNRDVIDNTQQVVDKILDEIRLLSPL